MFVEVMWVEINETDLCLIRITVCAWDIIVGEGKCNRTWFIHNARIMYCSLPNKFKEASMWEL